MQLRVSCILGELHSLLSTARRREWLKLSYAQLSNASQLPINGPIRLPVTFLVRNWTRIVPFQFARDKFTDYAAALSLVISNDTRPGERKSHCNKHDIWKIVIFIQQLQLRYGYFCIGHVNTHNKSICVNYKISSIFIVKQGWYLWRI